MSDERTGSNWPAIISGLSLASTAITGAVVFGELKGQVRQNTDAIRQIQADNRDNAKTLSEIRDTTTVIKTKLEILLPTSAVERIER